MDASPTLVKGADACLLSVAWQGSVVLWWCRHCPTPQNCVKCFVEFFGFMVFSLLVKPSAPKSTQSPEAVSPTKVWLETRCKWNRLGLLGVLLECLPTYISVCLIGT